MQIVDIDKKDVDVTINISESIEEFNKFRNDISPIVLGLNPNRRFPNIKNVIFNNPATIVFWSDGSKTVVKCNDEAFDEEKGLAMAISKKVLGNKGNYFNEFKKWLPEIEEDYGEVCMKVEIYADTVNDAYMFKTIFDSGLLNMPDWLEDEIEQHSELNTRINTVYHIKELEKKN